MQLPHSITLGRGAPHVAIVGCLHGDEPIGQFAITELSRSLRLIRGSITFVIAHQQARVTNHRYIESDLNRSFPGSTHGTLEERLAQCILQRISACDYVIDIHATHSAFDKAVIITQYTNDTATILRVTPIERVCLMDEHVFSGGLISHVRGGISLEYGHGKAGANYPEAVSDIRHILCGLGMIEGPTQAYQHRYYHVTAPVAVPSDFVADSRLSDFVKIKRGDTLGHHLGQPLYAIRDFYPLFLGKGHYNGTLALAAQPIDEHALARD